MARRLSRVIRNPSSWSIENKRVFITGLLEQRIEFSKFRPQVFFVVKPIIPLFIKLHVGAYSHWFNMGSILSTRSHFAGKYLGWRCNSEPTYPDEFNAHGHSRDVKTEHIQHAPVFNSCWSLRSHCKMPPRLGSTHIVKVDSIIGRIHIKCVLIEKIWGFDIRCWVKNTSENTP